jgi:hypothetical protein
LLDSVYEVEEVENARFNDKMFGATSGEREKTAAAISRLKLRWDVKKQDYTFADGTTPRIDRPGPYRRNIWKPEIPELNLTLTIERISRKAVEVGVRWTGGKQELRDRRGESASTTRRTEACRSLNSRLNTSRTARHGRARRSSMTRDSR